MRRPTGTISPDPDGTGPIKYAALRNTYDAGGNLTKVEKGELASWQSEAVAPASWSGFTILRTMDISYDAYSRKVKEVISTGGTAQRVTQYSYDALSRLECVAVRMNPATFGALPSACTPSTPGTYGPDRITRNVYDDASQLSKVQKAYGTSLQQDYATYTYSANGKQTSVTDANGNKASMTYDGHDRQSHWTFPSKTVPGQTNAADYEQYGYDANGNRTSLRKRDGTTIAYTYDALNRLSVKVVPTSVTGAAGYSVYSGYDLRGLQTYARFGSTTGAGTTNVYDGFGRLASETSTMAGTSRAVSYQYDANSNRTGVVHPDGNTAVYEYDGLDRMTAYRENGGTLLASLTYGAGGTRLGVALPGATTAYGHDGLLRLTSLGHDLGAATHDQSQTFAYNHSSQVVTRDSTNDLYVWTGAYNVSRGYSVNGLNQYTGTTSNGAPSASFLYDANGNLTSDGTKTFVYDGENRLVSSSNGASLVYDPSGRLFQTSGGSAGVTQFLYDGDTLLSEFTSAGAIIRRYVHGPAADEALLWYEGPVDADRRSLLTNHQGSIVAVANAAGNAVGINSYDPWGIPGAGNIGRFGYTGQAWIPELGMWYYKARIYSPTLGRFMQTDPIGYKDQVNLYAYAGNDPVNRRDPSGLAGCAADLADSQCADALRLQQEALALVVGARADLKHLREQRADGKPGIDARARATEKALRSNFGSSLNSVIRQIDRNLGNVQRFFQDPGTAKGGKYDYRQAQADEMGPVYTEIANAYVHPNSPSTVALNWPILRADSHLSQVQTFIHEPLHVFGLGAPIHGERYTTRATSLAGMRGGTATALGNNPDNYACFVAPGNC